MNNGCEDSDVGMDSDVEANCLDHPKTWPCDSEAADEYSSDGEELEKHEKEPVCDDEVPPPPAESLEREVRPIASNVECPLMRTQTIESNGAKRADLSGFTFSGPASVPKPRDIEEHGAYSTCSGPPPPPLGPPPFGLLEDRLPIETNANFNTRYFDGPFAYDSLGSRPSKIPVGDSTALLVPLPPPPRVYPGFGLPTYSYPGLPFSSLTASTTDHMNHLRNSTAPIVAEQPKAGRSKTNIAISSLINASNSTDGDRTSSGKGAEAPSDMFSWDPSLGFTPEPEPEYLPLSDSPMQRADFWPPNTPLGFPRPTDIPTSSPTQATSKQLPSPAATNSPPTGSKRKLEEADSAADIPVFQTPSERTIVTPKTLAIKKILAEKAAMASADTEISVSKSAEVAARPTNEAVAAPVAEVTVATKADSTAVTERPAQRRRLNSWARTAFTFALGGVATAAWMMASVDSNNHYFA
jgi:hypothetical protein